MYTPYSKIETLFERNTEKREGVHPGALLPELVVKNPVYGIINEWVWTEKIDGTNMRVEWEPKRHVSVFNEEDVTELNPKPSGSCLLPEQLTIGGKTDKAQLHGDLLKRMQELFTPEKLREVFPDKPVTFYGEGYGAGIQKIGGSYKTTKDFIGFDIFMHDPENRYGGWWFSDESVRNVYGKLGVAVVPRVLTASLRGAAQVVAKGFKSAIGIADAEGLVGRPVLPLFDARGHRIIAKLKTVDFDGEINYNFGEHEVLNWPITRGL